MGSARGRPSWTPTPTVAGSPRTRGSSPTGRPSGGCASTRPASRLAMPPATPTATPADMRPLAHHLGEDSLVNLVLVGGAGLSLMVVEGRARLAAARARLTRRVRGPERRPHDGR